MAELSLLVTVPDAAVVRRLGRSRAAVRVMRHQRGISTARDGRRLKPQSED